MRHTVRAAHRRHDGQLGQRDQAHELLDFFFAGQRPSEWHQWAESFIEIPNARVHWRHAAHVGGQRLHPSFLDMLASKRRVIVPLVIGAGVKDEWVAADPGVRVSNLEHRVRSAHLRPARVRQHGSS